MAHTVTLLADHKGFTGPRVSGDEHFVDATIDISLYVAGGVTVTAASLGLSTVTGVLMTGVANVSFYAVPTIAAAGGYASGSSFLLSVINVLLATPIENTNLDHSGQQFRLRVYGNL